MNRKALELVPTSRWGWAERTKGTRPEVERKKELEGGKELRGSAGYINI
jgi:hypothetical protein